MVNDWRAGSERLTNWLGKQAKLLEGTESEATTKLATTRGGGRYMYTREAVMCILRSLQEETCEETPFAAARGTERDLAPRRLR